MSETFTGRSGEGLFFRNLARERVERDVTMAKEEGAA